MGNLLGSPITEKDTHVGTTHDSNADPSASPDGGGMPYGISSMQGWRVHMEDAHIAQPFLYAEKKRRRRRSAAAATVVGKDSDGGDGAVASSIEATLSEDKEQQEGTTAILAAEVNVDDSPPPPTSALPTPPNNNPSSSSSSSDHHRFVRVPLPNHSLFAVFDGHGGSFAAEYASRNLLRVLTRSAPFVEYAERWNGREGELARLRSKNKNKGCGEDDDDDSRTKKKAKPPADDGDDNNDDNKAIANGDNDDEDFEFARATYDHGLMTLLERALRDAFLDLDAEILGEVRGEEVPDADLPYGEGYDLSRHSLKQCVGHLPKEAAGSKGNDGTDDAEGSSSGDGNKPTQQHQNQQRGPRPRPSDDEDAGTTAVCVLTTPKWIVCANAGDSRAVYSRSGRRVVPLSYDHKPDDEDEERRVREAGGYVSGGRVEGDLAVSRGLGDFRFKDPETAEGGSEAENSARERDAAKRTGGGGDAAVGGGDAPAAAVAPPAMRPSEQKVSPDPDIIVQNRDPKEDEFVIIACDGIWDVQTNQECVKMVADIFEEGETDLGLVCEEILDLCLIKGSKDNMTAAVIKFPKQTIGKGGGVSARRERRGASSAGKDGDDGEIPSQRSRAYNPYEVLARREEKDDDSDDDQWASTRG